MLFNLLSSAEELTPDEIINGAGDQVVGAVSDKIEEVTDAIFDGLFNGMGFAILYTVVALAVLGFVVGLLIYRFKRENLKDYAKVCFGVVAGLAITATVLMAYTTFYEINYGGGSPDALFKPILSLVCIALIGGCLMGVGSFFNKFAVKVAAVITGAGLLAAFIATMVFMTRYYNEVYQADGYYSEYFEGNGLIVSVVIGLIVLIVAYIFGKKKEVNDTKAIVYGAVCIAMAFALSYARLFKLPQGGSVTFASLLPLMVYCAMFGTRRGIVVCLIYGFLQALQDTYIIHPLQFLLDYPLAFGMIGLSGIFFERTPLKKKPVFAFVCGAIIAVVLRYACHICSGTFAFGADAAYYGFEGKFFYYSLAYNSFTIVDLAIDIVAGVLLFLSKAFRNQMTLATQTVNGVEEDEETDATEE